MKIELELKILKENKLLKINNEYVSFTEMKEKLSEEFAEVEKEFDKGDLWNLGLETFDLVQVCILILWRLKREGVNLFDLNQAHLEKLENREWLYGGSINIKTNCQNND